MEMKAEKNIKQTILDSIAKIYEEADSCDLSTEFFEKIEPELSILSEYFQTNGIQSFLIAIVFALNYRGTTVDLNDLNRYFHCNPLKLLLYSDDFSYLNQTGIFIKEQSRQRSRFTGTSDQFTINEKICEAILDNQPMPDLKPQKIESIYGLLEKLDNLLTQRAQNEMSTAQLLKASAQLIEEGQHFPLIEKVNKLKFNPNDRFLLLYLMWEVINGRDSIMLGRTLENIFDNVNSRMNYMQEVYYSRNDLLKNEWIELDKNGFFNNTYIELSERSKTLLTESGINLFTNEKKNNNILSPEDIPQRELIFSESEMHQLFLLKDLLKPNKLEAMQKRLAERNMPIGLTTLLHGAPGTGKTEIVKQLARETGRELIKVDISASKSMWFGESEKLIKRIFTDYKAFAENCKLTPILFFNEADAILSKRRSTGASNMSKTENAIQNILLEEIENFEGILFATTNLIENLDSAFDRRFLFKIKFQKPDESIKSRIWKLKLPALQHSECELLAAQFDFSGGQIDNIVRKVEIREVIYGENVAFMRILDFCREETFADTRVSIGFT